MPRYDYATRIASSKDNLDQLERHVTNPVHVEQPLPKLIVNWIVTMLTIVLNYFQDIMGILTNLVEDLERTDRISLPSPIPQQSSKPHATTSATRTRTSR